MADEGGQLVVNDFRVAGETLRVYDANGNAAGQISVDALPDVPTPVLEEDGKRGLYKIETAIGEKWLSRRNVRINRTAGVLSDCEKQRRLQRAKSGQNGYVSRALGGCEN